MVKGKIIATEESSRPLPGQTSGLTKLDFLQRNHTKQVVYTRPSTVRNNKMERIQITEESSTSKRPQIFYNNCSCYEKRLMKNVSTLLLLVLTLFFFNFLTCSIFVRSVNFV